MNGPRHPVRVGTAAATSVLIFAAAALAAAPSASAFGTYNAFGQGLDVTPLQMAVAMATIANDGVRMTPRVVRQLRADGAPPQDVAPIPVAQVISAATAGTVRTMLELSLIPI